MWRKLRLPEQSYIKLILTNQMETVLYLPRASDNTVDKKWLVLGTNFRLPLTLGLFEVLLQPS